MRESPRRPSTSSPRAGVCGRSREREQESRAGEEARSGCRQSVQPGAEPRGRPVTGKPRSALGEAAATTAGASPGFPSRVAGAGASPGHGNCTWLKGAGSPRSAPDRRDREWDLKRTVWVSGSPEREIGAEPSPPPPPRARLPPPPAACSAPPLQPRLWLAAPAEPWEPRTAPAAAAGATPAAPCGSWPSRSGCEPCSLGSSCK